MKATLRVLKNGNVELRYWEFGEEQVRGFRAINACRNFCKAEGIEAYLTEF